MDNRVFWSVLCAILVASGLLFVALATYWRYYQPERVVVSVPTVSVVAPVSRFVRSSVPFYAYGQPLPAGYICAGADGAVYRRRLVDGSVSIEPLYENGQLVRCGGNRDSYYLYR